MVVNAYHELARVDALVTTALESEIEELRDGLAELSQHILLVEPSSHTVHLADVVSDQLTPSEGLLPNADYALALAVQSQRSLAMPKRFLQLLRLHPVEISEAELHLFRSNCTSLPG
jgi:hypothetical protein